MSDLIDRQFEEIVVEYPNPELCTYPEYKGKPYFSIHYTENGKDFIGYGTYNPEVLSNYLKEYFMPSVQHTQPKPCDLCKKYGLEDGDTLYCSADWDGGIGFDYIRDIHYCPKCGRRLGNG